MMEVEGLVVAATIVQAEELVAAGTVVEAEELVVAATTMQAEELVVVATMMAGAWIAGCTEYSPAVVVLNHSGHPVVRWASREWHRAAAVPSQPRYQLSRGVWRPGVGVILLPSVALAG